MSAIGVRTRRNTLRTHTGCSHGEVARLPEPDLDVTVVIPYYNPGPFLRATVEQTIDALAGTGATFEVVAVSDGSTDGSEETLADLPGDRLRRVTLPHAGKGQAVRAGLAQGRGRYLGFIDGDGDVPPALLSDFVEIARTVGPDLVVGSKRHPDSDVVYPLARRLYSWGYQQLVHFLFHLKVRDTQAGIKLVRREVLADVLPLMEQRGYAFDLELFVLARRFGYTNLVEAPVRIGRRFSSTISVRAVVAMLRDTLAVFWRQQVRRSSATRTRTAPRNDRRPA